MVEWAAPETTTAQTIEDDRIRPVPGGVLLGYSGCTLSFNVTHWQYGSSFVTASHCPSSSWGQVTGHDEWQFGSNSEIGTEVLDPPYTSGSGCPSGRICRNSDAALFQYHDTVSWALQIARTTGLGSKVIDPVNPRWNVAWGAYCILGGYGCPWAYSGTQVEKVGRATGWTQGSITNTCVTVNVEGGHTHKCQMKASYAAAHGDSGAPVFSINGFLPGDVMLFGVQSSIPVGGGNSTFSWIDAVRGELGNPAYPCHGFDHSTGWFWC
jgi:hypothetical protein